MEGEMNPKLNRNLPIPIPCPKCEKKLQATIAGLEKNNDVVCSFCGTNFRVDIDEALRGLKETEKLLAKFSGKTTLKIDIKL
jgi:transcription elongation factor Elf1